MPVASFTVRVGAILVVLGVASYVVTGAGSVTALIPAAIGIALGACGAVANRSRRPRSVALQVAIAIAVLGLAATIPALGRLVAMLASGPGPARPALIARASMALILLVYVGFAVRAAVGDALRTRRP